MKVLTLAAALLAAACAAPAPKPVSDEVVRWKTLGTWSGRGNTQTESFHGLTGALRVHWKTTSDTPAQTGTLRLTLASAISGREILVAVDEQGAGEGTVYAAEDPRVFHMVVESADLDWWFTVEEASFGTQARRP